MTTDQLRLSAWRYRPAPRLSPAASGPLLVLAASAVLGGVAALYPESWRAVLAAVITINLIALGFKWPRAAVIATFLWLPFMALVRRLLIEDTGWVQNDPLLLVGPLVAVFLAYRIFVMEGRRLAPDGLSKLVLLLLVLALLGVINPLGSGGILGGLAGLIYVAVPLLWFFIGRELGSRWMVNWLVYAVIVVAVLVGAYGLYQTEFGSLPSWDDQWNQITGFASLGVGRTEGGSIELRPWSTFPSNSEYSAYLGIAIAFAVALLYHRRPVVALAIPGLAMALFLSGGRSVMALAIFTAMIITALRTRNGGLAIGVVIVGIAVAYAAALTFGPALDEAAGRSGSAGTERAVGGLLNPLDPDKSTFLTHWDNLWLGVREGFENPLGHGTGSANLGARAGGEGARDTDIDIGNAFVAFGFVGGLTFLAFVVLAYKTVFTRYIRGHFDWAMLAIAGLMVVTFGHWLYGGHYAASALTWFMIGWAVRPLPDEDADEGAAVPAPPSRS